MPMLTIDGRQYDSEQLSDHARQQLQAMQFIDRKLFDMNARAAALQTARLAYIKALQEILAKQDQPKTQ